MRGIVQLAILFYVSLLCSVQPGHAYDTRLSPLADNPFYAVSPSLISPSAEAITDDNHDHDPGLANADINLLPSFPTKSSINIVYAYVSQLDVTAYARGPPSILHY